MRLASRPFLGAAVTRLASAVACAALLAGCGTTPKAPLGHYEGTFEQGEVAPFTSGVYLVSMTFQTNGVGKASVYENGSLYEAHAFRWDLTNAQIRVKAPHQEPWLLDWDGKALVPVNPAGERAAPLALRPSQPSATNVSAAPAE